MRNEETTQNIPVGIIGPVDFMPKMRELLKRFPSFEPIEGGYRHVSEAPQLARLLMEQAEVLLFTGPIPYRKAKEEVHFTVPVHYVPLSGSGLYRALFRLERKQSLRSLSVDSMTPNMVQRAVEDMDGQQVELVFAAELPSTDAEALVRFHLEQHRLGHSTAAVTAIRSVSESLTAAGITNEWVVPSDQDVVVALERALLSTESRRSKEAQIVLGLIHIDDYSRHAENRGSEHEMQKMRLDFSRLLLDYVESLDGHLTHFGGDEYMLVTTRGIFEKQTGGYKMMPLAVEAEKSFGFTLSIGVGFGFSAGEAGNHARSALRRAKEAGGNACFIIREDGGLIGPLEMTEPQEFDLSLIDPSLITMMEASGMSVFYLSRLAAQAVQKGRIDYNARELAIVLGVSIRSAHRCLRLWEDTGLVQVIGEERATIKGRPRQMYRFSFLADHLVRRP